MSHSSEDKPQNNASENKIDLRFLLSYSTKGTSDKGTSSKGTPGFTLDVDLSIPGQGITAFFGHSGSGKTTLLRCIAGLEHAQQGRLIVNGETWQDDNTFLPTHKRPLGYVFQEPSLFPHLTAMGNLKYAMKRAHRPTGSLLRHSPHLRHSAPLRHSGEGRNPQGPEGRHSGAGRNPQNEANQLDHITNLLGIQHLLTRHPHQLSGGERQRVAIARALLINPRLLLMDEPLASLDTARKQEIMPYLEALHRELSIPILYVSHSIDEVARLADHLVAMDQGQVIAAGPLGETLASVDSRLDLGEETGVVWEATVEEIDSRWHLARANFGGGDLWLRDSGLEVGQRIRVRILANDVSLVLERHGDSSILNVLPATVTEIAGADDGVALVRLDVEGAALLVRVTQRSVEHLGLRYGEMVWAQVKSVALIE